MAPRARFFGMEMEPDATCAVAEAALARRNAREMVASSPIGPADVQVAVRALMNDDPDMLDDAQLELATNIACARLAAKGLPISQEVVEAFPGPLHGTRQAGGRRLFCICSLVSIVGPEGLHDTLMRMRNATGIPYGAEIVLDATGMVEI